MCRKLAVRSISGTQLQWVLKFFDPISKIRSPSATRYRKSSSSACNQLSVSVVGSANRKSSFMILEWKGCHHLVSFIHHDPKPRRRLAVNVCPDLAVEIIFVDHTGTAIRIHPGMTVPYRLIDQ